MVIRINTIEKVPDVTPLVGGVLDHATIVEGLGGIQPFGLADSYNCLDTDHSWPACPDPVTPGEEKEFGNPSWLHGARFAVYGGATCSALGVSEDKLQSEISRVFALKESVGVERGIIENLLREGPNYEGGKAWPTPPLAYTGSLSPEVGLALLEGHANQTYAGQPTIHIPRSIGLYLMGEDKIESQGGKLYTKSGAKVVLGVGYEAPNYTPAGVTQDVAATGTGFMYATGEVILWRSSQISVATTAYLDNEVLALAEREYLATVDCYTAAGSVTLPGFGD